MQNLFESKLIKQSDLIPDINQPRSYYTPSKLFALVASMLQTGFNSLKPLTVTPLGDGKYKIINGHRRFFSFSHYLNYRKIDNISLGEIQAHFTDSTIKRLVDFNSPDFPQYEDTLPCFVIDKTQVENLDLLGFLDNLNFEPMSRLDQALFIDKMIKDQYLRLAENDYKTAKKSASKFKAKLLSLGISSRNTKELEFYSNCASPLPLAYLYARKALGYYSTEVVSKLHKLSMIPSEYHDEIKKGYINKYIVEHLADTIAVNKLDRDDSDLLHSFCRQALDMGTKESKSKQIVPVSMTSEQAKTKVNELFDTLANITPLSEDIKFLPTNIQAIADDCDHNIVNAIANIVSKHAGKIDKAYLDKFANQAIALGSKVEDGAIVAIPTDKSKANNLISDSFKEFKTKIDLGDIKVTEDKQNKAIDNSFKTIANAANNLKIQLESLRSSSVLIDIDADRLDRLWQHINTCVASSTEIKKLIGDRRPEMLE